MSGFFLEGLETNTAAPSAAEALPVSSLCREFNWKIVNRCNYRCSYCFFTLADSWDMETRREVAVGAEKWLAAWMRMYELYGSAKIGITGGEPSVYPRFLNLAEALVSRHRLYVDTNLSRPLSWVKEFASRVRADRLDFGISFHPEFARYEEFVEKMRVIHWAGYDYRLFLVCYPPLLPRLALFQRELAREGFNVVVAPFRGAFEGREYPQAYSPEQEAVIAGMCRDLNVKYKSWVARQMDPVNPFGKPCHAGRVYIRVENDGSVWRCGQYFADGIRMPLGNFLDPSFRLADEPLPCAATRCGCEWRFLDECYGRPEPGGEAA